MILVAILCPGLSFFLRGKIISAVIAFVLQIIAVLTFLLFGLGFFIWLITAVWAVVSYNNAKADRRNKELLQTLQSSRN